MPKDIRNERFLLWVDGHKSRLNFKAALILIFYLFNVDLVHIPPHTIHLLQVFDVSITSPDKFDFFMEHGTCIEKQTARNLRDSMIKSFFTALRKSTTLKNISSGFEATGIAPININMPLKSQFTINNAPSDKDELLRNYWMNSEERLNEIFFNEHNRELTENDFNIQEVFNNLKLLSIDDGLSLTGFPPLYIEEEDGIQRIESD